MRKNESFHDLIQFVYCKVRFANVKSVYEQHRSNKGNLSIFFVTVHEGKGVNFMLFLQFILGLVPIIWLIVALTGIKMPGYKACSIAIVIAAAVAIFYKHMRPVDAATAILEGACNALWPILLVIIAALFTYGVTLRTGAMETIKGMLASVSQDKRILGLIIGWGFGCFMEGMAGFGTAVAIPASILVALGFDPLTTILGLLVVNSTPTAFGSVGVPTSSLAATTGLDVVKISGNTAMIQCLLMFISPFIMVMIIGRGMKALKEVLPITIISAVSFVVPNYIIATFIGPELPNIIGAIVSMIVTILVALKMKGKEVPEEYRVSGGSGGNFSITLPEAVKAWCPFILIFFLLLLTSKLVPFINTPLSAFKSDIQIYSGEGSATSFSWINTPGVWIILAGIIGGLVQGASIGECFAELGNTVKKNVKTIITICAVLATAKIMVHSGMTTDVANAMVAVTGKYFPVISPMVGVLGAFVTGSGTSTGALFGPLQAEVATQIGVAPEWLCAANSLGAGIGKMIAPSNIALGCASAGLMGSENKVMSKVFKYTAIYTIVGGIICLVLA